MYKTPNERLRTPAPVVNKEKDKDKDKDKDLVFVETCEVDFRAPPVKARKAHVAAKHLESGDRAVAVADTPSKDPSARAESAVTSIEHYKQALLADPYNADATLKLALAYHRVLRKGCAIAFLKRLAALSENPKFGADASIGRVVDNEQWFKPYREIALRAVGR
jgi:hypothetical protein